MKGFALVYVAVAGLSVGAAAAREEEAAQGAWRAERASTLRSFDSVVIGSLKDEAALRSAEVPRGHTFVASVQVGTPPQTLRCLLDTGSGDLWLPSKQCVNCEEQRHFHAELSSTFVPVLTATETGNRPREVRVDYGSGEVAGHLVRDTVRLGWRTFPNQSFIVVDEERLPKHRAWDGICGLGWRPMAKGGLPLYETLKRSGNAVFTLVPSYGRQVYVAVGEVPYAAIRDGEVTYAPAEPVYPGGERTYWVTTGELHVNGANGPQMPWSARFVVDTGTEFLLAPTKQYAAFLRALLPLDAFESLCGLDKPAGGLVVCDCAITESPRIDPRGIRVVVGGRSFALDITKLFRRVPTTGGGQLCLLQVQQNGEVKDPMRPIGELLGAGPASASGPVPAGRPPTALPSVALPSGESVDVSRRTMEDGAECVTRTVYYRGRVASNTTTCSEPPPVFSRRLSAPQEPRPPARSLLLGENPEDPADNLWILGGVFFENFVTVMDFEQGRLGFAEPAFAELGSQSPTPSARQGPAGVASGALRAAKGLAGIRAGGGPTGARTRPGDLLAGGAGEMGPAADRKSGVSPWGVCVLAAVAVAAATVGTTLYRKMHRRKFISDPAPETEAKAEAEAELMEEAAEPTKDDAAE